MSHVCSNVSSNNISRTVGSTEYEHAAHMAPPGPERCFTFSPRSHSEHVRGNRTEDEKQTRMCPGKPRGTGWRGGGDRVPIEHDSNYGGGVSGRSSSCQLTGAADDQPARKKLALRVGGCMLSRPLIIRPALELL